MNRNVNDPQYQSKVLELLVEADNEGLAEGEDPSQRAFKNIMRVMKKLDIDGYVLAGVGQPPEIDLINALQREFMFRENDIAEGGLHFGAFMFRDLFARLSVPIIFGSPALNPFDHLDFSENQKRWLAEDEASVKTLNDQFLDLLDLAYGVLEAGHEIKLPERSRTLLALSHYQLEASAGALCRSYGFTGSTQGALLAVELASKAALLRFGLVEDQLKRRPFGHDLSALTEKLAENAPDFDLDRVQRCIESFPDYVGNRYDATQPTRRDAGSIVMKCQFIVSEIIRQISHRNIRSDNTEIEGRFYPA